MAFQHVETPAPTDQEPEMQADVDAVRSGVSGSGGAAASSPQPPPGMKPPLDPAMQGSMQMMHSMIQMMQQQQMSFQQSTQGTAASGTSPLAASSPVGGTHRKQDTQMANVRPDERAFRRIEKFSNKKLDW